jgi:hypothetical protein
MKTKTVFLSVMICLLGVFYCSPALASFQLVSDPGITWEDNPWCTARDALAGQGRSFDDLNQTASKLSIDVNYSFVFTYDADGGNLNFKVQSPWAWPFFRSNQFLTTDFTDGFNYIRLTLAGDDDPTPTITVNNFTVNGDLIGSWTIGAETNFYIADVVSGSVIPFSTLEITGELFFSDTKLNYDGLPKMDIVLGAPVHTPLPPSVLLLGSGLLGLGLLGYRRKRG